MRGFRKAVPVGLLFFYAIFWTSADAAFGDEGLDQAQEARECDEKQGYCTAGVTAYLMDITEASIKVAEEASESIPADEVQDEQENQQDTDSAVSWEDCLIDYFGYLPTDADMDLFYRTVQAECGYYEPDDGVGAVADVIANRCRSDTFPNTITEVVTQENQFSTWANGMIEAAEPSDQVYKVCDSRITVGVVYSDILFFTAGYYNPYCTPAFIIGHHYFGTEKTGK